MPRQLPGWDLLLVQGMALASFLATWLVPGTALQLIIGLPFVIFVPGYVLLLVLFPRAGAIDGLSRAILSLATSVALVIASAGLVIAFALPFNAQGVSALFLALTIAMGLGATYRRSRLDPAYSYLPRIPFRRLRLPTARPLEVLMVVSMAVMLSVAGVVLYQVASRPLPGSFTVLYLLNAERLAYDYPQNITLGNASQLIIGILSREPSRMNYHLTIVLVNGTVGGIVGESPILSGVHRLFPGRAVSTDVALDPGETWERPFAFAIDSTGTFRIRFLLLGSQGTIYRETLLWINVTAPA